MPDDNPQGELLQQMAHVLERFKTGGDLSPIEDRSEWDKTIESTPPEERELIKELARFVDLWRYFRERDEKLGPEIVNAISELHRLSLAERTARLREINQKLMERVSDVGKGAQFRQ